MCEVIKEVVRPRDYLNLQDPEKFRDQVTLIGYPRRARVLLLMARLQYRHFGLNPLRDEQLEFRTVKLVGKWLVLASVPKCFLHLLRREAAQLNLCLFRGVPAIYANGVSFSLPVLERKRKFYTLEPDRDLSAVIRNNPDLERQLWQEQRTEIKQLRAFAKTDS